jgi:hypothetical protein
LDIWDVDKLVLFIAFVIPGFVCLKTYQLITSAAPQSGENQLIDAIAYSSINYGLLLWPIYSMETHQVRSANPLLYCAFWFFVLFVAPVSWACAMRKIRSCAWIQASMPHPTGLPWDFVFSQRKEFWIIVTLNDGEKIGGLYGANSFTSSRPEKHQIFLEKNWVINSDGGFERERVESAGILILCADIKSVELFHYYLKEEENER